MSALLACALIQFARYFLELSREKPRDDPLQRSPLPKPLDDAAGVSRKR
jgi:hypothetical protein